MNNDDDDDAKKVTTQIKCEEGNEFKIYVLPGKSPATQI